jgi:quinol monooxygenase YgiN
VRLHTGLDPTNAPASDAIEDAASPKLPGRNERMVKFALLVTMDAKPGKEAEVEAFLRSGQPLVENEPGTIAWFGVRMGPSTFGIFDVFPDEAGRDAHLSGLVAAALMEKAPTLFASPPRIDKLDVLAAKLP